MRCRQPRPRPVDVAPDCVGHQALPTAATVGHDDRAIAQQIHRPRAQRLRMGQRRPTGKHRSCFQLFQCQMPGSAYGAPCRWAERSIQCTPARRVFFQWLPSTMILFRHCLTAQRRISRFVGPRYPSMLAARPREARKILPRKSFCSVRERLFRALGAIEGPNTFGGIFVAWASRPWVAVPRNLGRYPGQEAKAKRSSLPLARIIQSHRRDAEIAENTRKN